MPDVTCQSCAQVIECPSLPDDVLYALQDNLPFLLICPSTYVCQSNTITLLCCGQQITVTIPNSATPEQKAAILGPAIQQCASLQATCGELSAPPGSPGPPNPPNNPITLYYNTKQCATVKCPDGTPFTLCVAAGTFAASTLDDANAQALQSAKNQAAQLKICLPKIPSPACDGTGYMASVKPSGGPFTFTVVSGSLPPGVTLNATTGMLSGTPTTPGTYNFTIRATKGDGSYGEKGYTLIINACAVTRCVQFDATTLAAINATYSPNPPWNGHVTVSFPNGIGGGSAIGIANLTNNDSSTITIQVINVPATADQWWIRWIWSTDGVLRRAQMGFPPNNLPYGTYSWDGVPGRPPGLPIFPTLGTCT